MKRYTETDIKLLAKLDFLERELDLLTDEQKRQFVEFFNHIYEAHSLTFAEMTNALNCLSVDTGHLHQSTVYIDIISGKIIGYV